MSTKPEPPAPERGERKPIPVAVMRFVAPMDAHGLSVASSVTGVDRGKGRPTKHRLAYLPWMRHFRLEFDQGPGKEPLISMVHEAQVKSWDPAPE